MISAKFFYKIFQQVFLKRLFLLFLLSWGSAVLAQSGPHGSAQGLSITLAKAASNHQPVTPTTEFKETDPRVVLTFRNHSGSVLFNSLSIFAENVEGFNRNQKIMSGNLQTPKNMSNSVSISAPPEGLAIGTYRLEVDGTFGTRFTVVSRFETADIIDDDLDMNRPNIALNALGGSASASSEWPAKESKVSHLNDGLGYIKALKDPEICLICGWKPQQSDRQPWVVVGFNNDAIAQIGDVVLDTRRFVPPGIYFNDVSDNFPKLVRISASPDSPTAGFQEIGTYRVKREFGRHRISFDDAVAAKYLRFDFLETYGDLAALMELEVYEAEDSGASVAESVETNIALPGLGGSLVTFSGYNEDRTPVRLFDDDEDTYWQSFDNYFPQDFIIAFKGDRVADLDRLEIALSQGAGSKSWPTEIAVAVSTKTPLDGFREVGRFPVDLGSDVQSLSIGQKTRFLKIRILDNNGADHTTMGEIRVFETGGLSPTSVILSDHAEDIALANRTERLQPSTNEVEPNDTPDRATAFSIGSVHVGSIDPLGEYDVYEIPNLGSDANALTLDYDGIPNIRHRIELLSSAGDVISAFDPGDLPARNAKLSFRLEGQEKFLRLSEPPASVVIIWDTSGSMAGSEEDLEKAVRQYVRRAPESQAIQLIRFSDRVEVLPGGFSTDKTSLARRMNNKFRPDGGTSLYEAIARGMTLLESRAGNKAIVVMTDGAHTGEMWHNDLWNEIDQNRIRLYTIGLGSGLSEYSPTLASTGSRVLRHLALATNGDSFFASQSAALTKFYTGIAKDLSTPATYILKPTIERGNGQVQVRSIGDQVPSAAMPDLHLVFDISGSMRQPTASGQSRIEVGREAWRRTSDTIPDGAPFILTLYGAKLRERDGKDLACTDIETVFEGGFVQDDVVANLDRQKPLHGSTPLVGSIEKAVTGAEAGTIIVIVTDGKDECAEDPVARMQALYSEDVDKLNVNIIGFDVGDPDVEASIRAIASAIHADFYLAENADELSKVLKEAFTAPFRLMDSSGVTVFEGKIGGTQAQVPTGNYTLEIDAGTRLHRVPDVRIDNDLTTTVTVNKAGAEMDIDVGAPNVFDPLYECGLEASRQTWTVENIQSALIDLVEKGGLPELAHPGVADGDEGPRTRAAMETAALHLGLDWSADKASRLGLVQNLNCLRAENGKFRPVPVKPALMLDAEKP